MLRKFLEFTGLVSPPPPPKRRPTARQVQPASRPEGSPPRRPEVVPVRPQVAPARKVRTPKFGLAVRTYIRQWDRNSVRPPQAAVDAAAEVIGADFAAYLTALHLINGQLMRFVIIDDRLDDAAAIEGLRKRLDLACYSDLDTWADAEKIDVANRKAIEFAGRDVPPALHIPDRVQLALIARMNERAKSLVKGGRAGGSSGGGPEPAPSADVGVPVVEAEAAGGRSKMPTKKRPDDEPEAEETATGRPLDDERGQPPSPEDGEPESAGGGPGLPRV